MIVMFIIIQHTSTVSHNRDDGRFNRWVIKLSCVGRLKRLFTNPPAARPIPHSSLMVVLN